MKQVDGTSLLPALEEYTHGFTINYTVPDLLAYGEWIGIQVKSWNMEKITNLRDLILEARDVQKFLENIGVSFSLEELGIDLYFMPTYPIPDRLYRYTIWAVDSRGVAMVGEDFRLVKLDELIDG